MKCEVLVSMRPGLPKYLFIRLGLARKQMRSSESRKML